MAHEMAHLMARDTFASTGLLIAFYLPSYIQRVSINLMLNFAARFIKQVIVQGILASLLGLVMLIGIVYYFHLLSWIMTLFVLGIFFLMLNWFFSLLYLADSRFTEYRRDAYARQIGYGTALKESLDILIKHTPTAKISFWHIFFKSTHPITQNRIRKLEK